MKKALEILKIVLVAFFFPLFFLKLDHETGVYPDGKGNIVKHHHYFSIVDNLKMFFSNRELAISLIVISFVIFASSIIVSILNLFVKNKVLKLIGSCFFIVSVAVAIIFIIISSTVNRVY